MAEQTPLRLDQNRLAYIDGMRGMAAMIVVVYHYLLCFYPSLINARPTSTIQQVFELTPLNILYNSSFAVCLFFVISGYALSHKYFVTKDNNYLTSSAIRRYFRLEIPILFSVLLSYLFLQSGAYNIIQPVSGITGNNPILFKLYSADTNFIHALKTATYTSMFLGGTINYNTVLWTMNIEFFGSLIVFATLALFGKMQRRFIIYFLLLIFLHASFIPAFIIGIALCDYYTSKEREPLSFFPLVVLFLVAIYVGSYRIFGFINIWSIFDSIASFNGSYPYIIGAALFLFSVINSSLLQKLFSTPLFQFLGKISFSIYLIHLLFIGTIGCFILNILFTSLHLNYDLSFVIMFFVSVAITIAFSYLMYKYIDQMGIRFSKWVYEKF